MSVVLLLTVIGAVFCLAILAAVVWTVTRSSDQIKLASACLFLCTLAYAAAAARLLSDGDDEMAIAGIAVAAYAAALYIVMAALAIFDQRWAWQAAVAAFGLHLVSGLAIAKLLAAHGTTGLAGLAVWLLIGAAGIWACLSPGTRQRVGRARAPAA